MKIRPASFASALFLLAASAVVGMAQDQAPTTGPPPAGSAIQGTPAAATGVAVEPPAVEAPAAAPAATANAPASPAPTADAPPPVTPSASAPGPEATAAAPPQGAVVTPQPAAAAPEAPQALPTPTPVAATPEPVASSTPDTTAEEAVQPPAAPAEQGTGPVVGIDPKHLPHGLSPWGMFMAADIVVKAVMVGLAIASVMTWTVWIAKSFELRRMRGRLGSGRQAIHGAGSLAEASQRVPQGSHLVGGLIDAAALELRLSHGIADQGAIKERVASRLEGIVRETGRNLTYGTGILASIGSTAPFIGLFGTVWGIMNSFIGIAESQTTNLAIVAPGIAEALLATAIGLVAAIPAVLFYNQLARAIAGCKADTAEAAAEIERLVSRDLDRGLIYSAVRAAE